MTYTIGTKIGYIKGIDVNNPKIAVIIKNPCASLSNNCPKGSVVLVAIGVVTVLK
jgi:hypothetical protein